MSPEFHTVKERVAGYRKLKPIITIKELLMIALGLLPYALAVNQMLVPHNIVTGGLTGLCEIIYFATDKFIPIWLSTFTINVVLLAIAFRVVGWRFCVRTFYGVFSLSMWYKLIPMAEEPLIHDPFMAVVIGGLLCGVGLGICFLNNGSSGGTDIIAMVVNKYHHMPLGRVLLLCDLIIISSAYFLPNVHSVEKVMFGLCFTFMCSIAVDWIMRQIRQSVQFFIFSKKYEEIADAINTRIPRGVTILNGQGWYSKQPMFVITVLAKKNESNRIFRLVHEIDPNAFVSQSETIGVFGQGFDPIQK